MLRPGYAGGSAQPWVPAGLIVRKVLCSIGAGPFGEILDVSGATFEVYARRHGYDLDLRRELIDPTRPASWNKIPLFLDLLTRYDLVVWVDADAAIVDPTDDIADALDDRDLMALVAHEYDGQIVPNCGVWVLRRDRAVRRILEKVWTHTEYLHHEWWENAALLVELGYSIEPRVEIVRRSRMRGRVRFLDRSWNSIGVDRAANPRINHYPGRSHEHRLERLTVDAKSAGAAADGASVTDEERIA